MDREDPLAVVQAWQYAVNRQDIDSLLELSASDIEIVGPRGSGHGHQLLRDWLGRAGLRLKTLRAFARDNVVVLAQQGVWSSVQTGDVAGERDVASRFLVQGHQVVQFARYDSLDAALREANLDYADERK